jgi:uncharacterized coiled-coil protein SlyX
LDGINSTNRILREVVAERDAQLANKDAQIAEQMAMIHSLREEFELLRQQMRSITPGTTPQPVAELVPPPVAITQPTPAPSVPSRISVNYPQLTIPAPTGPHSYYSAPDPSMSPVYSHTPAMSRQPSVSPAAIRRAGKKDAILANPRPFTGKVEEFKTFMSNCNMHFVMRPHALETDEEKVTWVLSLLEGKRFDFLRNKITFDDDHPLRHNYQLFARTLYKIYNDKNTAEKAFARLLALRQTGSVISFASDFQALSLEANIEPDNPVLKEWFWNGLKDELRKHMIGIPRASNLEDLIEQMVRVDNEAYHLSSKPRPAASGNRTDTPRSAPPYSKKPVDRSAPKPTSSALPAPATSRSTQPTKLGPDGKLLPDVKQYRIDNNLCTYCGNPGHDYKNCDRKPPPPGIKPVRKPFNAMSAKDADNPVNLIDMDWRPLAKN